MAKNRATLGPSDYPMEVEEYLKASVTIDENYLNEEFIRLPSDIAYWNERHAEALHHSLETYRERKRVQGEIATDPEFLKDLAERLGKKSPNVTEVEAAVLQHDDYRQALSEELDAERERVRLRGVLDALAAKRDSLISLGADIRTERQRDPLIRDDD